MIRRRRRQWIYAIAVAGVALLWLGLSLDTPPQWPSLPLWLFGVAAFMLVWHLGVPVPYVGLISLERVPQFALLLTFGPVVAAFINGTAALVWPFTSSSYNHGSWNLAALRGVHNMGLEIGMMLTAGVIYQAMGGAFPISELDWQTALAIATAAVALQILNNVAMGVYYWLDERDVSRLFTFWYAVGDLLFVPAGILAALLLGQQSMVAFWLLTFIFVVLLLSFAEFSRRSPAEGRDTNTQPLVISETGFEGRLDDVAHQIRDRLAALFRFDVFTLAVSQFDRPELDSLITVREDEVSVRHGISGVAEMVSRGTGAGHLRLDQAGSAMTVALQVGEKRIIGAMRIHSDRIDAFSTSDLHIMRRLARQFAGPVASAQAFSELDNYRVKLEDLVARRTEALRKANSEKDKLVRQLEQSNRQFRDLSYKDPLTGLANRRKLEAVLDERLAKQAGRENLMLLIVDLDGFKSINDTYGHPMGDKVLKTVAKLICREFDHADDLVSRCGGDEYIVVAAAITEEAIFRAQRLRQAVLHADWDKLQPGLKVTVSVGGARWSRGMRQTDLLSAADKALYRAKADGRNGVRMADMGQRG